MFGLLDRDFNELNIIFQNYPALEKVIIFGSRAKGNFKNGSDVDLSFFGKKMDYDILSKINVALNEDSTMPYKFDLNIYEKIENDQLKEHIIRVGKLLYSQ